MDELPIYGNESRVKVKSLRGPWQEVEIRIHSWKEIDTPAFQTFLKDAVAGFLKFTQRAALNLEDHTPWKKLGRKWHFMRKGFPAGRRVRWDVAVLEKLCDRLEVAAPDAQFAWSNQMLVRMYLNGNRDPWAGILTKRTDAVVLSLGCPKGGVPRGRIKDLGCERELDETKEKYDLVKISFRKVKDLNEGDLDAFLKEHLELVTG